MFAVFDLLYLFVVSYLILIVAVGLIEFVCCSLGCCGVWGFVVVVFVYFLLMFGL